MSFCQRCGADVGDANFCPQCGAPQKDRRDSDGSVPKKAIGVVLAIGAAISAMIGVLALFSSLVGGSPAAGAGIVAFAVCAPVAIVLWALSVMLTR